MAFLFLPSTLDAAGSIQPRVRIPKYAEVQGETIRLSDLLPPDAPAELDEIGARIILGNAPLPASQRVISREQIELRLREFPSIREQLDLPERLTVSCKKRRLSSDEIWSAIQTFLAADGLSAPRTTLENSLGRQAPVFVTRQDSGLVVKRMEADRVRRQVRFLMWTSSEPQVLPFYVTVDEPAKSADSESSNQVETGPRANLADNPERIRKAAGQSFAALFEGNRPGAPAYKAAPPSRATPPESILVSKGKPAKLVVETETLRMTVLVTPLESGAKGQQIRVKNLDTQRVFKADVVGEDLLGAALARE
ncbi:hypothetical protein SBA2_310009 [Acidobacteriia bacterium SbA2]|nr:hypothetical protein SBA2_310009 [Acidobacteriia bacterium SbA2]